MLVVGVLVCLSVGLFVWLLSRLSDSMMMMMMRMILMMMMIMMMTAKVKIPRHRWHRWHNEGKNTSLAVLRQGKAGDW